jgi:PEP-CTERM motif
MKRYLLATAVVTGAMWFGALPSYALPTTPLTGSDAVTGMNDVSVTGAGMFSGDNVPTNNSIATMPNLFTLNPGTFCTGSDCAGNLLTGTVTELLTVTLSGLSFEGYSLAPLTLTGTYTAKYAGTILGCAQNDGVSPSSGETDCFAWTGATNANYNGTLTKDEAIGSTGAKLELVFHNATDWSISPYMTAQIIAAPVATPEPATLAVLGIGLAGLGYIRRQRRAA